MERHYPPNLACFRWTKLPTFKLIFADWQPSIQIAATNWYHNVVRKTLVKEGWKVTHKPSTLYVGSRKLFADLGAERIVAAQKGAQKIAVEIKTFRRVSTIEDLQDAVGQFILYRDVLAELEPEREVFVAVPDAVIDGIFAEEIGAILLRRGSIRIFGYDIAEEIITRWLP